MKKIKYIAFLLAGTLASLAFAADVKPFYFSYISSSDPNYDSLQQEEWNYLMKFKMFGTNGITFGNEKIRVTDSVGWFGTSKGSLSMGINGKDTVGGPILVGKNLTFTLGPDVFTTGPLYVNGNVYVTGDGFKNNGNRFAGEICVGGTADSKFLAFIDDSKEHININNDENVKCPEDVPSINTNLQIPVVSSHTTNATISIPALDNSEYVITVPKGDFKDAYDITVNGTITMSNRSKIVIRQQNGGRLTRIFVNDGFDFRSSSLNKIVVAYEDVDEDGNGLGTYTELKMISILVPFFSIQQRILHSRQ